jgi:hypothetical protein
MKASEAAQIAKEKALTKEACLKQMKEQAEQGFQMFSFPKLSKEVWVELSLLGYKLEDITDPIGMKFTAVSWEY